MSHTPTETTWKKQVRTASDVRPSSSQDRRNLTCLSDLPAATDMESFEVFQRQQRDEETSAIMEIDQYEVCGPHASTRRLAAPLTRAWTSTSSMASTTGQCQKA